MRPKLSAAAVNAAPRGAHVATSEFRATPVPRPSALSQVEASVAVNEELVARAPLLASTVAPCPTARRWCGSR